MNFFKVVYARTLQKILYLAAFFLPFHKPTILDATNGLGSAIKSVLFKNNFNDAFIVIGKNMFASGLINPLLDKLNKDNIRFSVFSDFQPNPRICDVEKGVEAYCKNDHHAIIAIGGGSAMDLAKIIGARVNNPSRSIQQMKGLLKVKKLLPLFIAIPTTAGTGSETTLAAVITNELTHDKYSITDPKLVPHYVAFIPSFLVSLPGQITSTTGMDALTHAVEAFIGKANTKSTKKHALKAIKLIFDNLEKSYKNPANLTYRHNMQMASYEAGLAFTRAYVGSVHSVAHSLGGLYNIPHGLANAIILPVVLKEYGKHAYSKLAKLYNVIHGDNSLSKKQRAIWFISDIESLNKNLEITNDFGNLIKDEDLPFLVNHSYNESFPLYPTPSLLTKKQFLNIFEQLQIK